jgi:capsular exopolysaccharide synthesis family protein
MDQQQYNLSYQLKGLWRYKWRIVLVALFAGAVALILTSMSPLQYKATARLMAGSGQQRLTAIPSGTGALDITSLQDIGSQIEVIKSRTVLEQAITRLEPEKAADASTLQLEVDKLASALSVQQVSSTNLVEITVVSTDPALAKREANAIAEAYVNLVQTTTTATIQSALQDTTNRLEELQKASVDLSISPALPRLTAEISTALPALQAASGKLKQIGTTGASTNTETEPGTVLTASQLTNIDQRIKDNHSEANAIAALAQALKPVSATNDYAKRSSNIAIIESRTRALAAKLNSLSAELTADRQAETDPTVKDQLSGLEEQLQVAAATASAILDQVTTLYGVQEKYISATEDLTATGGTQAQSLAKEADANALNRIVEHNAILTGTLDTAAGQAENISTKTAEPPVWRFTALSQRADSVVATLQEMMKKLQPGSSGSDILLTHAELSDMEVQAQGISISLDSLASELTGVQSDESYSQYAADLLAVQESIGIASNATKGLGDDLAALSTSGGDVSYTALENLRQQLQLALLSGDTSGTRVVDTAIASPAGNAFTRFRGVLLACVAGLLLGAVGAFGFRYFDHTVRDASEVKNQIGLPLLASIDVINGQDRQDLSVLDDITPEYLESFRLLRTNLGLDSTQRKILMISSPGAREGKTIIAANLARVVALQGLEVLLIDGNLHHPGIASAFGLEEGKGLSDLLLHGNGDKDFVVEVEGVHVLPAGKPSMISAELFSSPRLKTLLEKARNEYSVVIIDSAPVMGWTDTRILARNVDSVILVLQNNASNLDLARESKQALEAMGVRVEGFVLNRAGPTRK